MARDVNSLAMALMHDPDVLILDEPFNGLDVQTSHRLRRILQERSSRGGTVFLSTHDMSLVERLCHRVGVMSRGKLIAEGAPAEVVESSATLEDAFLSLTMEPAR